MTKHLVLDANVIRASPAQALQRLKESGFALSLSAIALAELFGQAYRERKPGIVIGPLKRIGGVLETEKPIAADWPTLVHEVLTSLGEKAADSARIENWHRLNRELLVAITTTAWPEDTFFEIAARYDAMFKDTAEKTRKKFETGSTQMADSLTRYTPEEALHYKTIVIRENELHDSELPWLCEQHFGERIDAHCRYHAYCVVQAAQSHRYATSRRENDFQDIPLLFQFARPSLIVTRDYKFIEGVDRSGSIQAPWVTTVGELLRGRSPDGEPWGEYARDFYQRFQPRVAAALGALDQEALAEL